MGGRREVNVRTVSRIVLAGAVVLGLLAAVLIARYVNTATTRIVKVKTVPQVVASQDIPAGTVITGQMIQARSVPQPYAAAGAAAAPAQVVGRIAKVELFPGETVLGTQVATGATGSGLAFLVPNGQVALTIAVDQLSGFDGMLKAGDRVDVLAVLPAGNGVPTQRVTTALRSVRLLAVGNTTEPGAVPSAYTTVTLALSPKNAEEVEYLQRFAGLTLTLQSATRRSVSRVTGFDQNGLGGVLG